MKKGLKIFIVAMSLVLVIATAVGTTLALLTAKTDPVTNTFTAGKVSITLKETPVEKYKLIPGATLAKDPTVTVEAGSENCWLFVKVDVDDILENKVVVDGGLENIVLFTLDGWTKLDGVDDVYYRDDGVAGSSYKVFTNNQVTVNKNATTKNIGDAENAKITITAYACQKEYVTTVAEAWAAVNA